MPRPPTRPTVTPRKTPRQRRSADTVAVILEAAARILERQGLAAFNTNAVAELAGVSIGSLYQYFPGKDALMAALIRADSQARIDDLTRAVEAVDGARMDKAVARLVETTLDHQFKRPNLALIIDSEETRLALAQEARHADDIFRDLVARAVTRLLPDTRIVATLAQDAIAITRGITDSALAAGPVDRADLQIRITAAVTGYLRMQGRSITN